MILEEKYFDPSYIEIDRIIYASELFPIIHPKKANDIKVVILIHILHIFLYINSSNFQKYIDQIINRHMN